MMKNKEIINYVKEKLMTGNLKSSTFSQLISLGVSEKKAAYYIATYLLPESASEYKYHIMFFRALSALLTLIAVCLVAQVYLNDPSTVGLIFNLYIVAIPASSMYGFFNNDASSYDSFSIFGLLIIAKVLDFTLEPTVKLVIISSIVLLITYVYYVKKMLFPDYSFGPRKLNGIYAFTEKTLLSLRGSFGNSIRQT